MKIYLLCASIYISGFIGGLLAYNLFIKYKQKEIKSGERKNK
jgi:hypothetical protein